MKYKWVVYTASNMTVTVCAAGADTSAVTKPSLSAAGFLDYELCIERHYGRNFFSADFLRLLGNKK